jgi:hypothetical protein
MFKWVPVNHFTFVQLASKGIPAAFQQNLKPETQPHGTWTVLKGEEVQF